MAAIDLCSRSEVRAELELPASDTTRDSLIDAQITALSRAISVYCSREFKTESSGSTTRRFQLAYGSTFLDLDPYDLRSASSLTVKLNPEEAGGGTTLTVTRDYQLTPVQPRDTFMGIRMNPEVSGLHNSDTARNFGYTLVDVTSASWGFSSVPEDVKRACIVAVAANMDRRLDAFGAVQDLVDPDAGIQPLRAASFAIPTASLAMLAPYRRHVGAF